MTARGEGAETAESARNGKGRWVAGVSGNPGGRPKKKPYVPKSLADELAEAMAEKIPVIDARGRQELVPAFQALARQLVRSIPHLKPKELMLAMQWLQKLQVFDAICREAGVGPEKLTVEQAREQVKARLSELRRISQTRTLG